MKEEECSLNVVFDLGGVVFTWQPEAIVASVFNDSNARQKAMDEIFGHHEWAELDRGTLSRDEAIKRAAVRTGLPESGIYTLMQQVLLSLVPIPETMELIRSLKRKGNRIFALSNMHVASIDYLEQKYSFWGVFDGKVISCRIHMIKPEPEIYRYLLDYYDLIAEETIFIDDTPANLEPASRLGIRTVKFEYPGQCESELKRIGCI